MVNFNATRSQLNVSQEQFHALDKLDGKSDGDMSDSIFNQAKKYRECQMRYSPLNESETIDQEVKDILDRGITYWNDAKPGTMEIPRGVIRDREWDIKEAAARGAIHGRRLKDGTLVQFEYFTFTSIGFAMLEFAKYYLEKGTLNGCDLKMLPSGFEFVSYNCAYGYSTGDGGRGNDEEKINENGVPVYKRNPDKINTSLTISYQGKKYTFDETYNIRMKKQNMGV